MTTPSEHSRVRIPRAASRVAQIFLGIGLGLFLGWLAIRGLDWGEVRHALAGLTPLFLILALAIFLLGTYLRAARWRLLFVRERITVFRLFLVENAGIGLNSISPVRILAEPFQLGILTLRDRLPGAAVLVSMAVARVMDTVVNVVVVVAGVAVYAFLLPFAPFVGVGVLASSAGILLLFALGMGGRRVPWVRRLPMLLTFPHALKTLGGARKPLLLALVLSFSYWGLIGMSAWFVSRGLGMEVDIFFVVVMVQAAILFSTSVPGLPGAFGTFEFATVKLLDLWGTPQELAFSYALVLHLLLFLPSVFIALVVVPREGLTSMGAIRWAMNQLRGTPHSPNSRSVIERPPSTET